MVMLTYYFLKDLKQTSPSFILNVGSLASFMTIPGKVVYSATKSFIYSFSLSLRLELKGHNISVSCLCPGGTLTSSRVRENAAKVRFAGKHLFQQPEDVARIGVHKMFLGEKKIIPGFHNKMLHSLWKFLPEPIVDWILSCIFYKPSIQSRVTVKMDKPANPLLVFAMR